MKKVISLILACLFLFSLCACQNNADSKNLKEITLCLDYTPNTNHTGFYCADKLGYYESEGIRINIVQPPESGASLMCSAGQAQFAIDFQDIIAASFAQKEPVAVTAVAALLQHNTSGIMSRKGEGMDRPKGLEGKTYTTWDSPIEKATLKQIMEKDGGDFSKVKLNPTPITDETGALKNKDTDAAWIFYGWAGINAKVQNFDFDYFDLISIDSVFDYYTPILVANNDFLKNEPETAKAFLKATAKGYEYAIKNPEDAAKILIEGDTTGSLKDSEKLVTESQKWLSTKYIDDSEKWGVFDQNRWDAFYGWLWENKLIENEIPKGFGFTNDFLA